MISIRRYTLADAQAFMAIQAVCLPSPFPSELWWKSEQIAAPIKIFSAGALRAIALQHSSPKPLMEARD